LIDLIALESPPVRPMSNDLIDLAAIKAQSDRAGSG
jgi:hypothetical protein